MQTVGTTYAGASGTLYHRPNRTRRAKRNEQENEDRGAVGHRDNFLNARLSPIAPQAVTREWNGEHNYLTRENYEYLLRSAMQYARLMGMKLKHNPGVSVGEGISNLYDELDAIIGDINLNIETREDKLVFVMWKYHQCKDYTFFWLPVKFTESLDGPLKRIALTFLHDLARSNGMVFMNDSCDAEMILEWYAENLEECDDEQECRRLEELIGSYRSGRAYRLMNRVKDKRYYKNLPAAIEKYVPRNKYEERLTALMREGLQFIGEDKSPIMSYGYDPYYDDEADWLPVDMDRMIRIVYDLSDDVTEWLMDNVNSELRESYDISPATTLTLSPDCGELFTMDDYPDRFFVWFDKMVEVVGEEENTDD